MELYIYYLAAFTSVSVDWYYIQVGVLSAFALVLLGCGLFFSVIKITSELGRDSVTPRSVASNTLTFCLRQLLIIPLVIFFGYLALVILFLIIVMSGGPWG